MNSKRRLLVITAIAALGFGVWAKGTSASAVDCLGRDYLSQGGLSVVAEYDIDGAKQQQMRQFASAEALSGTPRRVRLVDLVTNDDSGTARRAVLVEIPLSGIPYELYGPVGVPPVTVSTPCEVVVLEPDGSYRFTFSFAKPVE